MEDEARVSSGTESRVKSVVIEFLEDPADVDVDDIEFLIPAKPELNTKTIVLRNVVPALNMRRAMIANCAARVALGEISAEILA